MKLPSHGQLFADAAKAFLAMGCFGAMAYFAFVAFTGEQAGPDALQEPAPAVVAPLQAPTVEQRQTDQAIAALIDKLENVIARGPSGSQPEENAAALLGHIGTLQASASLHGLDLVIGMRARFAARAHAAADAGHTDEARRLEPFVGPAILASQLETAVQKDRANLLPNPVPPASPNSASAERIDPAAPAQMVAAPLAPGTASKLTAAAGAQSLPALAPVRVVLTVARGDAAGAKRATDIKQALAAVGLEVADSIARPAPTVTPGIGYYFRSDRDAAVGISQQLEPLLGAIDPVLLRVHGSAPLPGTIEITLPSS